PTILMASALLSLAACKKKNGEDPPPTTSENITASAWRYDKAEVDIDLNGTADFPIQESMLESCERDNILTFRSNNTGTIDEGAEKCDASDPQSLDFTWTLSADEKTINFPTAILAGVDGDVKLVSVSATSMVLMKETEVPPLVSPSGKANIILTLKH
ncbi:MAG: lipocalin family protein, partial [Flavitalea sp.]